MCLAVIADMPNGHASAESEEASSSGSESVSGDSSTEETVVEEDRPAALPKTAARPAEPEGEPPNRRNSEWQEENWADNAKGRGKTEGKNKKGAGKNEGKCRYCWKRVKGGPAAMTQHVWWNESCLAWQYYRAGYDWARAKRMATAMKNQRMAEGYISVESSDEPRGRDVASKRRKDDREDKSWVPGPYAHEKRRSKDKKEKKVKKKTTHKAKKDKKKKGRKSSTTASRSPARDRRRRPPPSSDSTEGGKKKDRDGAPKRNAPRTLVIRL